MNHDNQKKTSKIIFHYLPPAMSTNPPVSFSVLKGFLSHHGYTGRIIQWNELTEKTLNMNFYNPGSANVHDGLDIFRMLPFFLDIAGKNGDPEILARLKSYIYSLSPGNSIKNQVTWPECVESIKDPMLKLIDSELEKLDVQDVIISGFSAKFFQWIPGIVFAGKLKHYFPKIKIVIGGFRSQHDSSAVMSLCPHFDFAVWGEGEYSLLDLMQRLEKGEQGESFDSIPHLVYRGEDGLKLSKSPSKYIDFNEYRYPDYDDILADGKESVKDMIILPLETSRGCHWNRCKFCSLNTGYRYRTRSPESVVKEIEYMFNRYEIAKFMMVDCDTVGLDKERFESLLDLLIQFNLDQSHRFEFTAEITHHGLNSTIIKKMAIAGFTKVQIGYEGITDTLLKKMDKKTGFADLLLFVKFAAKYDIIIYGANIIRGIIGETPGDVRESMENLPFLRFFLSKLPGQGYAHSLNQLRLEPGSRFLNMVKGEERKKWNVNSMTYLLPGEFVKDNDGFDLFGFYNQLENNTDWEQFENVNRFFEETHFSYNIIENNGIPYFNEFKSGIMVNQIIFNEPEYYDVLKAANDEVVSFESIYADLSGKYPSLSEDRLREMIEALKSEYILYGNEDLSRIVSIVDVP